MRPFEDSDLEAIRQFTDREIGEGYYSHDEVRDILRRSQKNGIMCSFVLEDALGAMQGVRISFPPGNWQHGKGHGLCPEKWPHSLNLTGYFQSSFLAASAQGQGWGGEMALKSLEALRQTGARGVVCHSWKESPHDSSSRYLKKLGFQIIAEHRQYWEDVPYRCTRCGEPPCRCTAQEMYFDLERNL